MTSFHIEAIPAADLDRIRANGVDVAGNAFTPFVEDTGGSPVRCCLRLSRAGERIALIAYRPPGTAGAYAEVGPVFVHAHPCAGYAEPNAYPAAYRARQQVLRAYDAAGRIADATLVDGSTAEDGIARLLADPAVTIVHSRNVLYGCYMFAIERA